MTKCCVRMLPIKGDTNDIVDTPGVLDTHRSVFTEDLEEKLAGDDSFKEIAEFAHICTYGDQGNLFLSI